MIGHLLLPTAEGIRATSGVKCESAQGNNQIHLQSQYQGADSTCSPTKI